MRGCGAAKSVYLFRFTVLKKLIREHKNIIKQNTPPGIRNEFLDGVLFYYGLVHCRSQGVRIL